MITILNDPAKTEAFAEGMSDAQRQAFLDPCLYDDETIHKAVRWWEYHPKDSRVRASVQLSVNIGEE